MSAATHEIYLLAMRLWRHTTLRAAGVPRQVLNDSFRLIRKAADGLDLRSEYDAIGQALYEHVLENASRMYNVPFCLTCKYLGKCNEEPGECLVYSEDEKAFELCHNQNLKAVALLDRVFGFDASKMKEELLSKYKQSRQIFDP